MASNLNIEKMKMQTSIIVFLISFKKSDRLPHNYDYENKRKLFEQIHFNKLKLSPS